MNDTSSFPPWLRRLARGAAGAWLAIAPVAAQSPAPAPETESAVTALEKFIVTESALVNAGHVLPTSRPIYSVFGEQSILDAPRSITALTPELMERLDITDFGDLGKIGAGTQQINFYGVPGSPALRGAKGGVFFNGLQRAFQRNEMPLSFGSLDAMDVVKGPAPAHFGAAEAGGYVNLIPKAPYFDRTRGSVQMEIGSYDSYRLQTDVGGPLLLGDRPAAYRVSLTGQRANSYYDRVGNDFISLYGAIKVRVSPDVSIFTGGEYFNFKSNENAGWNRPTQDLIDHGEYVIGEPVSIVSSAWGGNAVRTLTEFPFTNHLAPAFSSPLLALAIPGEVARARIPDAQRALMIDMNDAANLALVYAALPPDQVPGFASPARQPVTVAALGQVTQATQDVYIYTPAYLAAGGEVLTEKINGSTVLADDRDFAHSKNFMSFFDLESTRNPAADLKAQFLVDYIDTDKLSTYGYAISTEQLVLELKGTATQKFSWLDTALTYGASARYTDALMLQDFFSEPFSRRDISRPEISANTVILAGPQRGPDGRNLWSPTSQGGANAHSKLWQFSAFGYAQNRLADSLKTYTSLLVTHAPYSTRYPDEVDLVAATDPRRTPVSAHRNYYSASFSPVFTIAPNVNLYGTVQYGTALDPLQGGAIIGAGNFARNRLQEVGLKASLFEGKLYASASAFRWKQSQYDQRINNAELLGGEGVEIEVTYAPTNHLSIIASLGAQQVERQGPLGFRAPAATAADWALYGGVLAFNTAPRLPANNPALRYPGSPERQAKLFVIYQFENGLGLSGGPVWSAAYWHNFDHTLRLPASTVWHASIFFRRPAYEVALAVENVTNEDYFLGAEPVFGANTIITKAPTANGKLSVTLRF